MFGIGGGILIVPALVLLANFSTKMALGTSLGALLLPVGLLGAYAYWENGDLDLRASLLIASGLYDRARASGAQAGPGDARGDRSSGYSRCSSSCLADRLWFDGGDRMKLDQSALRRASRFPPIHSCDGENRSPSWPGARCRSRPGASRSSWTTPMRRADLGPLGAVQLARRRGGALAGGAARTRSSLGRATGRERLGRRRLRRPLSAPRHAASLFLSTLRARLRAQSGAGRQPRPISRAPWPTTCSPRPH